MPSVYWGTKGKINSAEKLYNVHRQTMAKKSVADNMDGKDYKKKK